MDGTIYQLDGENNGFAGSSLEQNVLTNARNFIMETEGCSVESAEQILEQGLSDRIGLSSFLGNRYQISRKQYFDRVWNINPSGIVKNFDSAVTKIKELADTGKKLVLVTSAPDVWQKQVFAYLGLTEYFEEIFSGETFGAKGEIFTKLANRYNPKNIVSVGDQQKTDIDPATALGIRGILVTSSSDVERIIL